MHLVPVMTALLEVQQLVVLVVNGVRVHHGVVVLAVHCLRPGRGAPAAAGARLRAVAVALVVVVEQVLRVEQDL